MPSKWKKTDVLLESGPRLECVAVELKSATSRRRYVAAANNTAVARCFSTNVVKLTPSFLHGDILTAHSMKSRY